MEFSKYDLSTEYLWSNETIPIMENKSANIFPFIFKSKPLSVFKEGDKFI